MQVDQIAFGRSAGDHRLGAEASSAYRDRVSSVGSYCLGEEVIFDPQDVQRLGGMAEFAVVGGLFLQSQLLIALGCSGAVCRQLAS